MTPRRTLWALVAAGVALRVIWAVTTRGLEYDVANFELLDRLLREDPLGVYGDLGDRRYPYPPGYLPVVWLCGRLSAVTGVPLEAMIALPPILADVAIALLVHRFAPGSDRARLAAAALVLLGPVFLVTSGYHHQMDAVAILPAVAAVALTLRPAVAGALVGLGAALKTVPGIVVLALLPHARGARERLLLLGGAALTTGLVTLPWLLADAGALLRQLDYTGVPGAGGLSLVVHPEAALRWLVRPVAPNGAEQLLIDARWLVVAVVAATAAALWRRRPDPAWGAALLFLALWTFGPALFLQYFVWGLPFLVLAGRLRLALVLQALLVVPLALFYGGPFADGAVAVPYAASMIAVWVLGAAALLLGLAGRELPWPRLPRPDGATTAVATALAAFGVAPLAWLQWHAWRTGDRFTGVDAIFAGDGLQYLWWIRDAGLHGLVADGFELAPATHVFTQPMVALSGLLWSWGLDLGWALQLWKPVAFAALLAGFGAYVTRTVPPGRGRAVALALALFAGTPLTAIAARAGLGSDAWQGQALEVLGKGLPAAHLHGYLPAALSFALMPAFLLLLERDRRLAAAAAGLLAAWLHPWQGVVLVLVAGGLAVWGRDRRPLGPAAATALPVLGYAVLARVDPSWGVGQRQNETGSAGPLLLLAAFAPLLLAALPELRRRPAGLQDRALRLWPVAAVAATFVLPSVPLHALGAITLPLAVLALRGTPALARPLPALLALALCLPGLAIYAEAFEDVARSRTQAHWLRPAEAAALDDLQARPGPGGVLAHGAVATAVPSQTGRRVWAGHPSWTPDHAQRTLAAAALFTGATAPGPARELASGSGARFLLAGCEPGVVDLRPVLGALVQSTRRHGCATVYELRGP